jgi:hypothetical protein
MMLDYWLMAFLDISLKGIALCLAARMAVFALRRASAAARHLVWQLAFAGLLALPSSGPSSPRGGYHCPARARPDLYRLLAVLTLPSWEEVILWSALLDLDLRDLVEIEVAHAERATVKTVQRWRGDGEGPPYRNEAGIRYPVSWYWDWRRKGRQTMTAQRATRGRRL